MDQFLQSRLNDAKLLAVNQLLRPSGYRNVLGVGIGRKLVDNKITETRALRIYVQSKKELDLLRPVELIPPSFLDIPTDIIEIGRLGRAGRRGLLPRDDEKGSGTGPGSSIRLRNGPPNVNQGAGGTLGAKLEGDGGPYILSCNHILSVNGRTRADGGTEIVTPALSADPTVLAKTSGGMFVGLLNGDSDSNSFDCAIVPLNKDAVVKEDFRTIDPRQLGEIIPPASGQKIQKDGAVTSLTFGTVVDVDADFFVEYSFGTFRFTNLVVIEGDNDNFAADGDSGSVVVETENKNPVAMIFAEAGKFALACPLQAALDALLVQKFENLREPVQRLSQLKEPTDAEKKELEGYRKRLRLFRGAPPASAATTRPPNFESTKSGY